MKVSQSKIKSWRKCHKQHDYKYNQKLVKKVKGQALFVGSIVHECIEAFYTGKDYKKILKDYAAKVSKMFDEEKVEYAELLPMATYMVEGYFKHHADTEYRIDFIERKLEVPLVEDIIFEGKIDAGFRDKKKKLWIGEHKTCASIPDEKSRMSDIQGILYWWGYQQETGELPAGIVWDYLRKKIPSTPAVLKNGEVSRAKCDTTYDIYLNAIKENGQKPKDYQEELERLRGNEDSFYRQIKLPFNKGMMELVVKDTISTALQIRDFGTIVTDRNLTRDCSWCDYFDLCQAELRGLDTDYIREKQYEVKSDQVKKIKRKVNR